MGIQTVCGTIQPENIGLTLMHEHVYGDFWTTYYSHKYDINEVGTYSEPISLETMGLLRRDPGALRENLILTDIDLIIREVRRFKEHEGSIIVDATPTGSYPSPESLRKISKETGVHIVSSTGYYMPFTLSDTVKKMSIREMVDKIVKEIEIGYDGTDIKAGIIGEVGAVGEMDEFEKKILEATAIAQKITGAAVTLHTACPNVIYSSEHNLSWGQRTQWVLDYLERCNADLSRVIVGHADVDVKTTIQEHIEVLKRGAVLEYDNFGQEHAYDNENTYGFSDWQRVQNIAYLINCGYVDQLILTTDLWQKIQYTEYGGWGFAHIKENICPMLLKNGVTEQQLQRMLVKTPQRLLEIK